MLRKVTMLACAVAMTTFGSLALTATPAQAITVYICMNYPDCAICRATYGDNCQIAGVAAQHPKGTKFKNFRPKASTGSPR
jgi:hypothetical protein